MVEAESIVIYHKDGSVQINLPNIWTLNRILFKGMTVVKKEGSHFDAIEILGIYDDDKYYFQVLKYLYNLDAIIRTIKRLNPGK